MVSALGEKKIFTTIFSQSVSCYPIGESVHLVVLREEDYIHNFRSQRFSDHNKGKRVEYSVPKLYAHARKTVYVRRLRVALLTPHNVAEVKTDEKWGSTKFHVRAMKASLIYPILTVRGKDGKTWVADGMHRLYKAQYLGRRYIRAYQLRKLPDDTIIKRKS